MTQAIIRCCSHPLKSTVEQQLENYEPDIPEEKAKSILSIGKTITYENYLPLWKSILNVTSSKVNSNFYCCFFRFGICFLIEGIRYKCISNIRSTKYACFII